MKLGGGIAKALTAHGGRFDSETENFVTHALRGEGFDASEDGTGRGTPLTVAPTLTSNGDAHSGYRDEKGLVPFSFQTRIARNGHGQPSLTVPALTSGGTGDSKPCVSFASGVRRLTPRECERLQGFTDDYTLVTYRKKPAADGPRYKAIGNSMAVPVMRWIGQRIRLVQTIGNLTSIPL